MVAGTEVDVEGGAEEIKGRGGGEAEDDNDGAFGLGMELGTRRSVHSSSALTMTNRGSFCVNVFVITSSSFLTCFISLSYPSGS